MKELVVRKCELVGSMHRKKKTKKKKLAHNQRHGLEMKKWQLAQNECNVARLLAQSELKNLLCASSLSRNSARVGLAPGFLDVILHATCHNLIGNDHAFV